MENNSGVIQDINSEILSSYSKNSCNECNKVINPKAAAPKDQKLSCGVCGKSFHKRCTNRRKHTKPSWQTERWFCKSCILGYQPPVTQVHPPTSTPHARALAQAEDDAIIETAVDTPMETGNTNSLNPTAAEYYPQQTLRSLSSSNQSVLTPPPAQSEPTPPFFQSEPTPPPTQTEPAPPPESTPRPAQPTPHSHPSPSTSSNVPHVRFPRNATRQKNSNVVVNDPDKEFLQTAVDSCRSTIVQLETDLKRANENLDMRNKRIIQLESQVKQAASRIGGR